MHRVLAVDDSHVIRRLVEVSLDELDVEVSTAPNGARARQAMLQDPPDLLLIDLGLPDISGWDVIDFVAGERSLDGLEVIVLSGYGDADDQGRASDLGVAGYLVKPFRPADLRRMVMDVLRPDLDHEPLGA
jgi:DNA-binding response OmpR family regulator